jgi:predicted nucleic acid-binding protein
LKLTFAGCERGDSVIVDSDVLVWALRKNPRAAAAINAIDSVSVSIVTVMELFQGARDKREANEVTSLLDGLKARVLPLTESVGFRALTYIEEHALSTALGIPDALIAATAVEAGERILTGNDRHFRVVQELGIQVFRP